MESEARLRSLAEAIPQLVWTATPDGVTDYLGQQWYEFTGQTPESSVVVGWQAALHPEDQDRVVAAWKHAVISGEVYEVQTRLRYKDASYRWVLARCVPMRTPDGAIGKWFGTCTDIQQQKETEEALRRSEKLAAIARLASSMAHEINNPLAGVTNLLFLLGRHCEGHSTLAGYVKSAQQELGRVAHIANQTLGLYRESSAPVPLKVSEVLDDLLEVYAGKIQDRQIVVDKRYGCTGELVGFRGEMRQLFSNLLLNSFESAEPGGVIKICIKDGYDPRTRSRAGVRVLIADNGCGIPSEHRQKLFEPFFTTKTAKGTGLGLWIAQGIVHKYGGSIRLRSSTLNPHRGTSFSIFLPTSAVGRSAAATTSISAA